MGESRDKLCWTICSQESDSRKIERFSKVKNNYCSYESFKNTKIGNWENNLYDSKKRTNLEDYVSSVYKYISRPTEDA